MQRLDRQIAKFESDLVAGVAITIEESRKVATHVATDVRFLPKAAKDEISLASWVPLQSRFKELVAFQRWSDFAVAQQDKPEITHAAVIVQTYVCFVYLKDACFEILAARLPTHSVTAKCCAFLSRAKVRDFRNAFSHGNWCYSPNIAALDCWVALDARDPNGPHRQFQVTQAELDFWQTLSRGVAYATYQQLCG